jgi:hypothetical protein
MQFPKVLTKPLSIAVDLEVTHYDTGLINLEILCTVISARLVEYQRLSLPALHNILLS